jgi:hypothetical protein
MSARSVSHATDVVLVNEINARERLQEAKYFLDRMKEFEKQGSVKEFIYHFDGFLVAWHSIYDNTILYDFAERFSLPFTRKEYMTDREFELAAKWLKQEDASVFLKWLRSQVGKLKGEYKVLFDFRQQVVHRSGRTVEKKTEYHETTYGFVNTSGVSAIVSGALPAFGDFQPAGVQWTSNVTPLSKPTVQPEALTRFPKAENLFYFLQADDPKGRRVIDACESAYGDMARMLTEAQIEAWKK